MIINRDCTIKPDLNVIPFATNLVIVPFISFEGFLDHCRIRFYQYLIATGLIIKATPPSIAHISLITAHLEMIWNTLAAKLDAAIVKIAGAHELEFNMQYKIRELCGRADE